MKTSTYIIHIAHQTDVHHTLVRSEEHEVAYDSTTGAQFLTIAVNSIYPHVKSFNIRYSHIHSFNLRYLFIHSCLACPVDIEYVCCE